MDDRLQLCSTPTATLRSGGVTGLTRHGATLDRHGRLWAALCRLVSDASMRYVLDHYRLRYSKDHKPPMNLQLHQREKEGISILDLKGQLTIGEPETILRDAIVALAAEKPPKVILNLVDVGKIDDDGLGAVVFCYAWTAKAGGKLKLLNLPAHLSLMILSKLDTVFEVFSDEQDAVNSFFPDRAIRHFDILEWVQEQEELSQPDPPK
jgi:anti-sigma B factor antagonist